MNKGDLGIFEGLSVVRIEGYEPEAVGPDETIDPPGTANFLVEQYGMHPAYPRNFDPEYSGILWTDYENPDWSFSVLVASDEVEALRSTATEAGYTILGVDPVTEPMNYGDSHGGAVEILKHRDGWVIFE
jgi:hypothetical protein